MNLDIIQREIKSKALQEVVRSLTETVNGVKDKTIEHQQANVEIVGCKHIIQSIALDWMYGGRIKSLQKITTIKRIKKT